MNAQDLGTPFLVRAVDEDLAIETPSAEQRRIEDFGAVGSGKDHDSRARIEAIHFGEQLIEGLLLLVVPPGMRSHTARPAKGVEFIDENNSRRSAARLCEQIAHARRAHTHKHLHELGARNVEE